MAAWPQAAWGVHFDENLLHNWRHRELMEAAFGPDEAVGISRISRELLSIGLDALYSHLTVAAL